MRIPPFNPYIAVFIGVFAISTTAILIKLVSGAPISIIANFQLLIALLIMAPIIFTKYKHEFQSITNKNWVVLIGAGIILTVHLILLMESLQLTSVSSSALLLTLQFIFTLLLPSILRQERLSSGAFISAIIILFGNAIILRGDFLLGGDIIYGDVFAILAAIALSISQLFGQKIRRRVSVITYTFILFSIGAAILIIYNIVKQHSFVSYPVNYWWVFIALAIIPTFFGHFLFNWAAKWMNASAISFSTAFQPAGATILALLILNEMVSWYQVLGGSIILFGLIMLIVSTTKKTEFTISKKENK
ncbi:DMT family transporter [Oceanobacillus chungangensis]|uniref:EamA family transporter n=1 Tax=Oceanobacillus chungangensis TaxID=1229152 RepID=A0A3D8PIL3_9BACI|nr:DMT family transporter [Oceanobacillus chungangensis]RDW15081.1 EamA family transporter [Oceanobacillus chungangensis]